MPQTDWPQDTTEPDDKEISKEARKLVCTLKTPESPIDPKKYSRWSKLIRITAYVLKFVKRIRRKTHKAEENPEESSECLYPRELNEAERYWIKNAQKDLHNRVKKGELATLSPYTDSEGAIRVRERADKATVSYKSKHLALLPYDSWISLLITRQSHSIGHNGVATTAAKVRRNYWIIRGHDLAKSVKYKCVFCKEMQPKPENQVMADPPQVRLAPHTPPFYFTSCDYFGPYK